MIFVDSIASNCENRVRLCSLCYIYGRALNHTREKMFADGWTWWTNIGQLLRSNVNEEPQHLQLDIDP
jgi:hypothetical protein